MTEIQNINLADEFVSDLRHLNFSRHKFYLLKAGSRQGGEKLFRI